MRGMDAYNVGQLDHAIEAAEEACFDAWNAAVNRLDLEDKDAREVVEGLRRLANEARRITGAHEIGPRSGRAGSTEYLAEERSDGGRAWERLRKRGIHAAGDLEVMETTRGAPR